MEAAGATADAPPEAKRKRCALLAPHCRSRPPPPPHDTDAGQQGGLPVLGLLVVGLLGCPSEEAQEGEEAQGEEAQEGAAQEGEVRGHAPTHPSLPLPNDHPHPTLAFVVAQAQEGEAQEGEAQEGEAQEAQEGAALRPRAALEGATASAAPRPRHGAHTLPRAAVPGARGRQQRRQRQRGGAAAAPSDRRGPRADSRARGRRGTP